MLVDRLQPDNVPLPTPSGPGSLSSNAHSTPKEKQRVEDPTPADQVLFSGQGDARLVDIRLQNERQNGAALAIRDTDRAAQILGQKIDAVKKPLQTIVKNFPPFSPEDKERLELLRSYTSLRKEIDQLTLPPPPPSVVEPRKQPALPEPLAMNADDSQIADQIDKLDATALALTALRSDVAADTSALLQDGRFYRTFSAPKGAQSATSYAIQTESSAAQKSAEIGQQFAESVSQGVTAQYPQFLKGLS